MAHIVMKFFRDVIEKFKKKCAIGIVSEHSMGGPSTVTYDDFLLIII